MTLVKSVRYKVTKKSLLFCKGKAMHATFSMQVVGITMTAITVLIAFGTLLYTLMAKALAAEANEQKISVLTAQIESVSSLQKAITILEGRVAFMESEKARQKIKEHSDSVQLEYFEQALRLILDANIPAPTRAALDAIMLKVGKEQEELRRALNNFDADNEYFQNLRFKAMLNGDYQEPQKPSPKP